MNASPTQPTAAVTQDGDGITLGSNNNNSANMLPPVDGLSNPGPAHT